MFQTACFKARVHLPGILYRRISPSFSTRTRTPSQQSLSRQNLVKQGKRSVLAIREVSQAIKTRAIMSEEAVATAKNVKLKSLREIMESMGGYDALVVPTTDPHLLEYAPVHYCRRAYLTGFDGSAGLAVVTKDEALLWTDGRYFIQAENQLEPEWTLMKAGTPKCPRVTEWLCKTLKKGDKVALDPQVHPQSQATAWKDALTKKGVEIVFTEANLVDKVWGADRPSAPKQPVRVHPENLAGESVSSKLDRIRTDMTEKEAQAIVVAKLEEIAWILNLRGNDDPYTPIFISYLIIDADGATLFIEGEQIPPEVATYLSGFGVAVKPYEEAQEAVAQLIKDKKNVWMNPDLVNASIFEAANAAKVSDSDEVKSGDVVAVDTPITSYMAEKNESEVDGMKEAHLRDAAAIVEFLSWFEKEIAAGKALTEVDIDLELTARRAKQPGYVSLSFPTIAGVDGNGAVIHYRAVPENCKTADSSSMLLIDSGGQYDCGTTDVTRTFHLGDPSDHQKLCFTKVLQGHIGLACAVFPEDTPGIALDVLARGPLWSVGLDYMHGTGHGVGAHLCVHEGPVSISPRTSPKEAPKGFKPGMIVSNEPGYYEDGNFGCRLENLVLVKAADTPNKYGDKNYLLFETITLVPFQRRMMVESIMSAAEKTWLNTYHAQVWEKISTRVKGEALEWLKENTAPIPVC